MKETEWDKLG